MPDLQARAYIILYINESLPSQDASKDSRFYLASHACLLTAVNRFISALGETALYAFRADESTSVKKINAKLAQKTVANKRRNSSKSTHSAFNAVISLTVYVDKINISRKCAVCTRISNFTYLRFV